MLSKTNLQYFFNRSRRKLLADNVRVANTFFSRMKGLLGTDSIAPGTGLYIVPCPQIHMMGMKYAIDAVFINKANRVVGLVEQIRPGEISKRFGDAVGCLELPAGTIAATRTEAGDVIEQADAPYCGDGG